MRDFKSNDRVIGSELRSALVDAPERATYVVTDTNPTAPTDLEVGCEAGTVVIDGSEVSVSAQTESVSDISGEVAETAYRYHTLSVDATGALVVRSSDVGEFDATEADAEPITQVTEPSHETGEVFIGTAFQVGAAVERVFDGRYLASDVVKFVEELETEGSEGTVPTAQSDGSLAMDSPVPTGVNDVGSYSFNQTSEDVKIFQFEDFVFGASVEASLYSNAPLTYNFNLDDATDSEIIEVDGAEIQDISGEGTDSPILIADPQGVVANVSVSIEVTVPDTGQNNYFHELLITQDASV